MTVSLVIVPRSVAYAALAGMPLVTGIYASFLPALVPILWSTSTRVSVGPTALSSLLVAASLAGVDNPTGTKWIVLAGWLALISGAMQIAMGIGKFG